MNIVVLGSDGQLGKSFLDSFKNKNYKVKYLNRKSFDLLELDQINQKLLPYRPNIIINCAAFTNVDGAESSIEIANKINNIAVKKLAEACKSMDAILIHFSTDYIYDGKSRNPYKENDTTNPCSVYGETKLQGEIAINDSNCKHLIIRTSWVYSEYGNNFLKTIYKSLINNNNLKIINDQFGSPTYSKDISDAVLCMIEIIKTKSNLWGTYNFGGKETLSWYDFAKCISDTALNTGKIKSNSLISKTDSKNYITKAIRPEYSALDCSKIKNIFGISPSNHEIGIKRSLDNIRNIESDSI